MITVELDRDSGIPLSRQIAGGIRAEIEARRLSAGDRLPAERALALRLGVDRMTVGRAYEELARAGLVDRQVGRGSFVRGPVAGVARGPAEEGAPARWARSFAARTAGLPSGMAGLVHAPAHEDLINLSSLFPDPGLFPLEAFGKAMADVIERDGVKLFGYGSAAGYPPLRRYIAETMRERGVDVAPDEIVITNGSQQGIDLVARAFLDPGDRVALEDPTYTGAVQVFHSHGAQVAGVPRDDEGMVPEALEDQLARSGARLVYLIPNFQNPTSGTLGLERRRRLLDVALAHGVPILEDDFGGDLRYEGEELPPLKALDARAEGVVYLSTFAKKLVPGLRIGWIAAPPEVVERLTAIKRVTDWSTSLLLQGALHEFCVRGHLDAHMKRVVAAYRERRDAMLEAMARHFPREVRWTHPAGGLVIWVTLPPGIDAEEAAVEARAHGVLVSSGDLFFIRQGSRSNLRLVFGQAEPGEIRRGIRALGGILRRKLRSAREAAVAGDAESLPVL